VLTPTIARIQAAVAQHFGLSRPELVGPSRLRIHARPRQLAMLLAHDLTGRTLKGIGIAFGWRCHTTVIHAIRAMSALIQRCAEWNEHHAKITAQLCAT
jgi:chromosomal replication initiator protein